MLKIKNEVNLQELLYNYGFEYGWDDYKGTYCYYWKNDYDVRCIIIYIDTRQIYNSGDRKANVVLYDLIQAGLVEKVEG